MSRIDASSLSDVPWDRYEWRGKFIAVDDCPAHDLGRDDVAVVLAYGQTADDWDGSSAGLVLLRDGRVIGWESVWGPTGSGFSCDAYGGDADIICSWSIEGAMNRISDQASELLVWPDEVSSQRKAIDEHLVVALDAHLEGRDADAATIRGMAIVLAGGEDSAR